MSKLNISDIYNFLERGENMMYPTHELRVLMDQEPKNSEILDDVYNSKFNELFHHSVMNAVKEDILKDGFSDIDYESHSIHIKNGKFDFNSLPIGVYKDLLFENEFVKFSIPFLIKKEDEYILYNLIQNTKFKFKNLFKIFIMVQLSNLPENTVFRNLIFSQSKKKMAVDVRSITPIMTLSRGEISKNKNSFDLKYIFNLDELLFQAMSKHGQLCSKRDDYCTKEHYDNRKRKVYKLYKEFSDNILKILNKAKKLKEKGKQELKESASLFINDFPTNADIENFNKRKVYSIDFKSEETIKKLKEISEDFSKILGKKLIFYDFETCNPKISLFDNYERVGLGLPVQISIYEANFDNLKGYSKKESFIVHPSDLNSFEFIDRVIESLYDEEAIYVIHSKYEVNILEKYLTKCSEGNKKKLLHLIDENNILDTAKVFESLSDSLRSSTQKKVSSIKLIEKYLLDMEASSELVNFFNIKSYDSYDISNGFMAQAKLVLMYVFPNSENSSYDNVHGKLIEYCDQDVRMMIFILQWLKDKIFEYKR